LANVYTFQVERTRHFLLLREKLVEQDRLLELSKLDKEAVNKFRQETIRYLGNDVNELSEKERIRMASEMEKSTDCTQSQSSQQQPLDPQMELMNKCLKLLLKNRINSIKAVQVQTQVKPG
jgi:hypothetical protein